jgi:hypothetical protein
MSWLTDWLYKPGEVDANSGFLYNREFMDRQEAANQGTMLDVIINKNNDEKEEFDWNKVIMSRIPFMNPNQTLTTYKQMISSQRTQPSTSKSMWSQTLPWLIILGSCGLIALIAMLWNRSK